MSEVVISRRGGSSSGSGKNMVTEYITENKLWTVPKAKDQKFDVRIFGAGGGSRKYNGAGGGWMNNDILVLTKGESIQINIGGVAGWNSWNTGGSSSFGGYLSANGGTTYSGGSGGADLTVSGAQAKGYQFGGGPYSGRGGPWGGGGYGGGSHAGGTGGIYGGGGGSDFSYGGNGGYYGGGGGGGRGDYYNNGGLGGWYNDNGTWKQSGLAGNGGRYDTNGENGTNTIGWANVLKDENGNYITGSGTGGLCSYSGSEWGPGGGGFGLWIGNSFIASYACGGYSGASEPGICIISYYPVD